ncbi:MAG: hypothetical protein WA610_16230 [Thermodesulfovibrionales bacterium]
MKIYDQIHAILCSETTACALILGPNTAGKPDLRGTGEHAAEAAYMPFSRCF